MQKTLSKTISGHTRNHFEIGTFIVSPNKNLFEKVLSTVESHGASKQWKNVAADGFDAADCRWGKKQRVLRRCINGWMRES